MRRAQAAAAYPAGVRAPVQYGPRIGSLILCLSAAQLIPVKRLSEALLHLYGVSLSQGTVCSVPRRAAARHAGFWHHLRSKLAAAPARHFDETRMRVGGRLRWFRAASAGLLCRFRLGESRGDIMAEAAGIAVHDHWKPYFSMPDTEHAVCSALLLRGPQALADHDDEIWAENMRDCLQEAIGAAKGGSPPDRRTAEIENHYDLLAGDGIRHHEALPALRSKRKGRPRRRPGYSPAVRLRDYRAETLRFLRDPAVPPTNNTAERGPAVRQGQAENLRRVPDRGRGQGLRGPAEPGRDRPQAGLGHHHGAADGPGDPDRDAAHRRTSSPGLRPGGARRRPPNCPPE